MLIDYFTRFKVITGGQTGADRAALDSAITRGIEYGGWCPRGRKAEDGTIPSKYQLTETESANYRARTVRNVVDSDATLIFNMGDLEGGSLETLRIAERRGKPVRVVQMDTPPDDAAIAALRAWLADGHIRALNIAGPRESKRPGVYRATLDLLERLFAAQ